jgi:hypothetical protein
MVTNWYADQLAQLHEEIGGQRAESNRRHADLEY